MANEKRLIEYEAVYKYAFDGVHGGNLEDEDFSAIINAIDAVPIVDAVEVVRCKDCKECYTRANGTNYCRRTGRYAATDDFCSYGERRDGE